jgi:signal transduction histidine kinase/ActR/RegA family two-component response regulator
MNALRRVLQEHREHIVQRFVREVEQTSLAPEGTRRSSLVDHIPRFLDELEADLERARDVRMSDAAAGTNATARQHGEQRWQLGYDIDGLVREYGILRQCILDAVKESGAGLSIEEYELFANFMSVGVAQAVTEYTRYRDEESDRQNANIKFLEDAGRLLSSTLDYRSTLDRLAGLIVPRMADWCAIHFEGMSAEDMPLAHVDPSKMETLRELYRRYPLTSSAKGYPRVIETGEPFLISKVEPSFTETLAQDAEHLELIRKMHTVSWLTVPLNVHGRTLGALTLAFSESPRHYSDRDLVVAGDLANRAAVAIDNARLYELSQTERSRVEAATRAKDEFVAMVSHELRTPLNAILGWLALMRGGTLSAEKREHALEVIERNARAQSRLVGDLLDISRTLSGTLRIHASQLDLSNVVEIAIEGLRPATEAKRIHIEVDLDRKNASMRGDGERLQQVVWNLLVNAVKFTPKGGVIKLRLRRVESDLELTVEDNGIGIPKSFLPHIFESFRQVDSSSTREHGGLGIGLSIAKHIVDLHGGTIEARSEGEGRGSLFTLRLPVSPLVSTTIGISRVPATEQRPSYELPVADKHLRVLVVDDDDDAREMLSHVFEAAGIECREADSAAAALTTLDEFVPDVVVSDIGMPEEDGYALIRRVRTLGDDRKSIPAIALTAFASNEDRTRALVDGFNLHLTKPVEPAKLVNAVLDLARAARLGPGTWRPPQ